MPHFLIFRHIKHKHKYKYFSSGDGGLSGNCTCYRCKLCGEKEVIAEGSGCISYVDKNGCIQYDIIGG